MTDIPDLIKRLRIGAIEWGRIMHGGYVADNAPYEAADALEAQQAEIERLEKVIRQEGTGHAR